MKTFRFLGVALFTILLCLSACSGKGDEPIEPAPKPEVVKSEITIDSNIISNGLSFSNDKGEQSISFTTNENWTLSVAATTSGTTWCTASATSGTKGSTTVKFTVIENTDYENRSVSVTIKSGTASKTFTITQKSADALLVTIDKYEVSQKGGTIEIEVKANIDYQMEISEAAKDWITESSGRALSTYKHKLDISINENAEKREGEIIFKSGDKSEIVKVYQTGGAILLLSQNECNVSDKGDTISVEIKSNIEFGIQMPDVDWITDEASSRGMSSHSLRYVVDANETTNKRSAEIIYYDKNGYLNDTLKIVQYGITPTDTIEASFLEHDFNVIIKTTKPNQDIKIEYSDWLTLKNNTVWVGDKYTQSCLFSIEKNQSESIRNGYIKIIEDNRITNFIMLVQRTNPVGEVINGCLNVEILDSNEMNELQQGCIDKELVLSTIKKIIITGRVSEYDTSFLKLLASSYNLEEIDLSNANVTGKIPDSGLFSNCSKLKIIHLPINFYFPQNSFLNCTNLETVIHATYDYFYSHTIGYSCFSNCKKLTSITIPKHIYKFDAYCFSGCSSLSEVHLQRDTPPTDVDSSSFSSIYDTAILYVPKGKEEIYRTSAIWNNFKIIKGE